MQWYILPGWVSYFALLREGNLLNLCCPVANWTCWKTLYLKWNIYHWKKGEKGVRSGISCPIHLLIPDSGISSEQHAWSTAQFGSVAQSRPTLCDPMDCSTPGLPVHHQLPEFNLTHIHWVGDAIQPSHTLLPTSPLAFNLSQHQGLFKWVSAFHQVAKVMASASTSVLAMNIQDWFPLG